MITGWAELELSVGWGIHRKARGIVEVLLPKTGIAVDFEQRNRILWRNLKWTIWGETAIIEGVVRRIMRVLDETKW